MAANDNVHKYLGYLVERNLNALVGCFAEEVDWYIPGDTMLAPWTGRRSSKAEIRNFFETLWEQTIPLDVKVEALLCDETNAVITGQFSTRMRTAKVVVSPFSIHLRFAGDQIVYYRLLEDSLQVAEALRG